MVSSILLHLIQTKLKHQHDRVNSFKISRQTWYIDSETAGPWCLGREPYLGGSVNMDAMKRELLILIFQTDSFYRNG